MRNVMLSVVFDVVAFVTFGCGCTETVPPGYVGMVMEPAGLTGVPLQPGRHSCWGRDEMVLIETKEFATKETMSILCADDLNFKFDLVLRTRLRATDGNAIKELLNKQGSNVTKEEFKNDVLKIDSLYDTYVRPAARNIARGTVGVLTTTGIREKRGVIQKEIMSQLKTALKSTPMELVAAYPSNFDYPDVITKAVEKKRQKEIEIEEERAKQAMELLKAENRKAIADKMRAVRAAEADAEAAYIAIVGKAITPAYLKRMEIEANQSLYKRVAAGDKVIVTGDGAAIPMVGK